MVSQLSVFWMFAIVLYHTSFAVEAYWYKELMSDCRMGGVGFFFLVSGYFLMKRYEKGALICWWKGEVYKRIFSVLVPYFTWCAIGVIVHCIMNGIGDVCDMKIIAGMLGLSSLLPMANTPLWYLKFLFIFVFLSPMIIKVVLTRRIVGGGVFLAAILLPLSHLPCSFSFFFSIILFSIGMYWSLWLKNWRFFSGYKNKVMMVAVCFLVIVLFVLLHQYSNVAVRMYRAYLLIIASFIVAGLCGRITQVGITLPTFFVFCAHGVVIRCMPIVRSPYEALILAGFVFVVLIGVALLLKHTFPRVYAFLTAGR